MSDSSRTRAWLAAGYAGLAGFLVLEAAVRRRGSASSLDADAADAGTTDSIVNAYAAAALAPLAGAATGRGRLPGWARPCGLLVESAGIGLRWWSMTTLRSSYTRTLRQPDDDHLVDTGPYALVRHPGYLGSLLIWLGFALTSGRLPTLGLVAVVIGRAYGRRITAEEALLLRNLPGYADYARRTDRLVPGVW